MNCGASVVDAETRSAAAPETAAELLAAAREAIGRAGPGEEKLLAEMVTRLRALAPAQAETADALVEITHYFLATKTPAMESAAVAVLKARELEDTARICLALRAETWAATDAAEFGTAMTSGIESVTLAEAAGLIPAAASAWNMLGCVFLCMNQHRLAHACFQRCMATGAAADSRQYHECAAGNLFTSQLMQGNLREAASTAAWLAGQLEHAEVEDTTVARAEQALLHCSIAEAMIVCGDFGFAEAQIARVKDYLGPTRVRSRASDGLKFIEALMRLARGESASLEITDEIFGTDPSDISSLHAAIAVYESTGQFDKALQLLRTVWDRSRSRYLSSAEMRQRIAESGIPLPFDSDGNLFDRQSVRITSKVDDRLDALLQLAITASATAGYAPTRVFRVSKLARIVGAAAGLDKARLHSLDLAGKLYDIGMVAVDRRLLARRASLSVPERVLVSEHAQFGADLLSAANLEVLAPCIPVARLHHECWDGNGPLGLKNQQIPMEVTLISLCDTFDALIQPRPWRPAFSGQDALAEIRGAAGRKFDPGMCDLFLTTVTREMSLHRDFVSFLEEDALENETVVLRNRAERMLGFA